ncbi:MAG: carboxylating nicotinate-nucleotide diphosphorylase [Bacteroidota bacterium]
MNNPITENWLNDFIRRGIAEDVGDGDHTALACIPSADRKSARLIVKQEGVIAGLAIAEAIFHYLDPSSTWKSLKNEGEYVYPGQIAAVLEANTRVILKGERLALNTMQRMSGIATLSHRLANKVADLPVRLIDTRKTTPLLRPLEKRAVLLGGCENYSFGLFDRVMKKDNHIDASGSITQALKQVHNYLNFHELQLEITVEVRNKQEIEEVLAVGGCQRIMLDNFSPAEIKEAIVLIGKKMEIEASGGINEDNLREYAETGVDFISLGALTHSAGSLDLSLKIIS